MADYSTNEFKPGLKILLDNAPCVILENEFIKPGKGQAFNRVKYRNLKTERVLERSFRSGESVPAADVMSTEMMYLFFDGDNYIFMANDGSAEQVAVSLSALGNAKNWLKEEEIYVVTVFNEQPILVEPPHSLVLEVVETEPGVKGDTVTGGTKPAKLNTGVSLKVPLFVNEGELILVDTKNGEYLKRA